MKTFIEFIYEEFTQRYEYLKSLLTENIILTSKIWILPNGEIKSIMGSNKYGEPIEHFDWFWQNEEIAKKYDVILQPKIYRDVTYDTAFDAGFFRVTFESNGALNIEGRNGKLSKKIKDALFMLVLEHPSRIRYFNLYLYNDLDDVVYEKEIPLFTYDDEQEKLMALDGII